MIHSLSLFLIEGIRYGTHLWGHRQSAVRDGIHGDGGWKACNKPSTGCNVLLDESSLGGGVRRENNANAACLDVDAEVQDRKAEGRGVSC